jgi:hypothetical protein
MSGSKRYVLDANAFIEAKNRYYGLDICPGFWDALIAQDDEIKEWVENQAPDSFFKKTEDQAVIAQFQDLVEWVYSTDQFADSAKAEFASVADGWVIAYAAVNELVVVTHEEFAPAAKRKVPMPNVCVEFDVEYVNTFEMLRSLNERFVRGRKLR